MKPQVAKTGMSDVAGIFHVGVPNNSSKPWQSASGGVGPSIDSATLAAIGEGVERYTATLVRLPVKRRSTISKSQRLDPEECGLFAPEQRTSANFPFANLYAKDAAYTNIFDFETNQEVWTTHGLVALNDDYMVGVPTSSGLGAGPTRFYALTRAIQELIERDALMTTWMHSLAGKRVAFPKKYQQAVDNLGGEFYAFDITPSYSPHPVCAVAGMIPERGKPRFSLGVACRDTWQGSLEKAYYEWCQGVFFAGYFSSIFPDVQLNRPDQVNSFDDHAIYYTLNPDEWTDLPLLADLSTLHKPKLGKNAGSWQNALSDLRVALSRSRIRLFYRELTTIDALQSGVYVMRALSPDMTPIFAHQNWPFLGGKVADIKRCYKNVRSIKFPNPMPHPLG